MNDFAPFDELAEELPELHQRGWQESTLIDLSKARFIPAKKNYLSGRWHFHRPTLKTLLNLIPQSYENPISQPQNAKDHV